MSEPSGFRVVPCASVEQPGWLMLREALWPQSARDEHRAEMATFIANRERYAQFVAYGAADEPVGFVEAALRSDYVNGTDSSPVAFVEGLYVAPAARRQGVGRALVRAVVDWAASRGKREIASDALLEDAASHAFHRAVGFEETERVVFFRKQLADAPGLR